MRRRIGPIHTARRVFKPSRPDLVEDPFVMRMQKIRTLVGLAAVVWMSVAYKIAHSVEDVASDRLDQSWISVLVLCVTLPVVVGVLLALTAPSARRDLLRRAGKSFGAMVALVAAVFVFPASVLTGFMDGKFATNPVMAVVTGLGMAITFFWVLPFIIWGIGLALIHVFRTADIHQTMPPLLAMTLVWEMALIDLLTGAYAGVPVPVRVVFVIGAPVSVTAVALWELRRLRTLYGISVRGVLVR
ncbi:integral membrane protein [Streptomyces viridochromogenes DSM 40736]|uniref:Integral membrane protein n=2 Tax=Streptomyces viridochromogenes TaxID=1938 RepID=D9XIM4_STRVT|nr:integral membrane protein [Streptomyces viridochromogenes DSM 40736]